MEEEGWAMNEVRAFIGRYIFAIVAIVLALLFALLYWEGIVHFPSLLIAIFVIASVVLLAVALFSVMKQFLEFGRWSSGETHPLLYKRVCKDVKILDERGDATIEYKMYALRTYGAPLKQLVQKIVHDGKLELREVRLDGNLVKPEIEELVVEKKTDKKTELVPQPYIMKIKILFPTREIKPNEDFNYSYILDFKEVYPKMTEKNAEFSFHYVLVPTRWLKMKLSIPKDVNLRFVPDGVTFKVIDKHEAEDFAEEQRVREGYKPKITPNRRKITWEIHRPKISSYYKLYFRVKKSRKSYKQITS